MCPHIVTRSSPCPAHGAKARRRTIDEHRGTSSQRGYDARWRRAREAFLAANPLCSWAERHGRTEAAAIVDHVKAHRGNMELFWLVENWQPLSAAAHARTGMKENGMIPCEEHGQAVAIVKGERVCCDCGRAA